MQDALTSAIAELDWHACARALSTRAAREPVADTARHVVDRIRESGRLLFPRADPGASAKREQFLEDVRTWLAAASGSCLKEFNEHIAGVLLVEQGFHGILETLRTGPNRGISVDAQVWSLISHCGAQRADMDDEFEIAREKPKDHFIDPSSIHISGDDNLAYDPDAVTASILTTLSSSILMFAHEQHWFAPNGAIELPAPPDTWFDSNFKAEFTLFLGAAWQLLDYSTERWRFFGGSIVRAPIQAQTPTGELVSVDALRFQYDIDDMALYWELADTVAHERLDRMFLHIALDAHILRVGPQPTPDAKRLAPAEYLSAYETSTFLALCHAVHFDVIEDDTRYAGLQIREWVRGYAALIEKTKLRSEDAVSFTCSWSEAEILAYLQEHGLSSSSARTFLDRVTFGKRQQDLFDAPLLRARNGRLYCIPRILQITNLPRVILSHLGNLSVQISRRGRALETELHSLFRDNGLNCVNLRFSHNDEEYECDGALVWDDRLFLFECKNRSMSGQRPSKRHRFVEDVHGGVRQVLRVADVLSKHPEIAQRSLGSDATWNSIVPVVLNGLPWSLLDQIDGVYVYDMSALGRFFESGVLNMTVPLRGPEGPGILLRHPIRKIWRGARPTADDLLRELDDPLQLIGLVEHYGVRVSGLPISPSLTVIAPKVCQVPTSLANSLGAYVGNPDAVNKIIDSMRLSTEAATTALLKFAKMHESDEHNDDDESV